MRSDSGLECPKKKNIEMTILHVFSGDLWAGAERMILTLLSRLKGYEGMRIIALSLNEGTLTAKLRESGIETIVIPENANSFFVILWKACRCLRGRGIELIHGHGYKEHLLAVLISKVISTKRLVSTLHGLPEPEVSRGSRRIANRLIRKCDFVMLKHLFTRVVAVSEGLKASMIQKHGFDPAKVEVIHNGIDYLPPSNSSRLSCSIIHIGTVGRMVPVKDFGLFLDVAKEIRKQRDNIRFSILGDGPLKDELTRKAKESGLEGIILFEEHRPDPTHYYQSIDVYLNTSLHEGLPLSILEAMACGKPIVAPNVGGLPEIITHGKEGFLVETRDPRDFAQWCLKLARDSQLRSKMGQNAAEQVSRNFSSERMADSYKRLYESLFPRSSTVSLGECLHGR
jgi:L-malate glycosyltransferase